MGAVASKTKSIQNIFCKRKFVDRLCDDIWLKICCFLDGRDFIRVSQQCKFFHELTNSKKHIIQRYWQCICRKQFPFDLLNKKYPHCKTNACHKLYQEMQILKKHVRASGNCVVNQYHVMLLTCVLDLITICKTMRLKNVNIHKIIKAKGSFKINMNHCDKKSKCRTLLDFAVTHHSCNIVQYLLSPPNTSIDCGKLIKTCLMPRNLFNENEMSATIKIFKLLIKNPNLH